MGGTLRRRKELGESQVTEAKILLQLVDVCVKDIFEQGKHFPWPRPPDCPRCHGRIWGYGYVAAYFDGFAQGVFLRRYRCPDCHLILRLRPRDYWSRFQASIPTILESLTYRLCFYRWPPLLSRQRQGHWLRSLIRKVRYHLGAAWEGGLMRGLRILWGDRGIVPVSRVIQSGESVRIWEPTEGFRFAKKEGGVKKGPDPNERRTCRWTRKRSGKWRRFGLA